MAVEQVEMIYPFRAFTNPVREALYFSPESHKGKAALKERGGGCHFARRLL